VVLVLLVLGNSHVLFLTLLHSSSMFMRASVGDECE
jgi:hypothetical protein